MNDNDNMQPIDAGEVDPNRRILIFGMIGVIVVGICALFFLAFSWLQPNQNSLLSKYFASPTPTRLPSSTPAPTNVAPIQMTATPHAWIKPAESPSLDNVEAARSAVDAGESYLETVASVTPYMPDVNQPGDIYTFEIELIESMPLVWSYGWCTTTKDILEENFTHIQLKFLLNDTPVPLESFAIIDSQSNDGSPCREYAALVKAWPAGEHHFESQVTFTQDINDGWNDFPAGTHSFSYIVTVKP